MTAVLDAESPRIGNTFRPGGWERGYQALSEFVDRYGHANPSSGFVCDDKFPLGRWVVLQRCHYSGTRLSSGRATLLSGLPGWVWDARQAQWLRAWFRLSEFAREHGHACPLSGHTCEDGFRLGSWVSTQRNMRRRHRLPEHRAAMLETLPGWQWGVYAIPPRPMRSAPRR